ncbi:MAG: hypothetical protein DMD81_13690 [Candidatus Rokuibacteriota bacterium]|nr:MAG: hypothetical protein DMD81_13690 [Candidatus Rokubacteria bacterium]
MQSDVLWVGRREILTGGDMRLSMKRLIAFVVPAVVLFAVTDALAITLFAGTGQNDGGRIITIDSTTGVGTLVGSSGFNEVSGLAFSSSGTLFGAAWNSTGGELWTINPTNAAQTFVGTITGCTGNNFVAGIGFSPSGTLFGSRGGSGGVEDLVTLNKSTAACTPIGSGSGGANNIADIVFDLSSGTLFGVTGGSDSQLLTINPVTGAETMIGLIGFNNVSSLAVPRGVAPPPTHHGPIPTLGEWGVLTMVIFLAATALWTIRSRRPIA